MVIDKVTGFAEYFRKVPAAFLVAISSVLALILFLPDATAQVLAVDVFRVKYRVFLGPALLLTASFMIARVFGFFRNSYVQKQIVRARRKVLHNLTPEEKGYLVPFIHEGKNTINASLEDGIMMGLAAKGITFRPSTLGDLIDGFAFNLHTWAREYLVENPELLEGAEGAPKKLGLNIYGR